jgi:hypothetical protein
MTGPITEQVSGSADELGPAGWVVVEFPGSRFKGEIAPALGELVERGIVRVLDLLLTRKGEDGTPGSYELRPGASPACDHRGLAGRRSRCRGRRHDPRLLRMPVQVERAVLARVKPAAFAVQLLKAPDDG